MSIFTVLPTALKWYYCTQYCKLFLSAYKKRGKIKTQSLQSTDRNLHLYLNTKRCILKLRGALGLKWEVWNVCQQQTWRHDSILLKTESATYSPFYLSTSIQGAYSHIVHLVKELLLVFLNCICCILILSMRKCFWKGSYCGRKCSTNPFGKCKIRTVKAMNMIKYSFMGCRQINNVIINHHTITPGKSRSHVTVLTSFNNILIADIFICFMNEKNTLLHQEYLM